jgi:hypothetical protein
MGEIKPGRGGGASRALGGVSRLPGSSSPEFRSACPTADGLGSRGVQNREDGKGILT